MSKPELSSSEFLPICLGCSDQRLPTELTSLRNFPELGGKQDGLFISLSYLPMHEALTHLHLHIERVHDHAPDVLYLLLHRDDAQLLKTQSENVIFLYSEQESEEPENVSPIAVPDSPSLAEELFTSLRYVTTVVINDRPVKVSIGQGPQRSQPWLARRNTGV